MRQIIISICFVLMSLCRATGESFGLYYSTSVRYGDVSYTLVSDISVIEDCITIDSRKKIDSALENLSRIGSETRKRAMVANDA